MARVLDITVWYEALATPLGVVIEVEDLDRAKAKLYSIRAARADPDLESISIVTSPVAEKQLWLVKRNGNAPP